MGIINPPPSANGQKNKAGRPFGALTKVRRCLRDLARKSFREAFENIRKHSLYDENSFVRLAATKEWLDRGFGKPVAADEVPGVSATVVNVLTGVRGDAADMQQTRHPRLPDGCQS